MTAPLNSLLEKTEPTLLTPETHEIPKIVTIPDPAEIPKITPPPETPKNPKTAEYIEGRYG